MANAVSAPAVGDAHAPDAHGPPLKAALLLAALGVVFGDIGTSPIYALKECFRSAGGTAGLTPETVLGILSLVFWAITIVVTLKYVLFVMRADNQGEGGDMALLALAMPTLTDKRARRALLSVGLVGAALLYGDGMITPAISVLSAVEGLSVATPFFEPYVVPIALAVLIGLFAVQVHGSGRIGRFFGPVMALWFTVLACAGLVQVLRHPDVFAAIDPRHGAAFLARHGWTAFVVLGSVFLTLTGAEALFADMGHFGRGAIRINWFVFVFPALVLNYFGQGALVIADPGALANPFFLLFPSWSLVPMVVLATAATVIASQAVIAAAYTLSQQAISLGLLPRLEIRQTSRSEIGQVYIPQINWMLAVAVVGLVLGFRSSDALASAYGIAVVMAMLATTTLAGVVARRYWGWSLPVTIAVVGFFLTVDLAFFAANLPKVLQGGWFPLLIGAAVFTLMMTWQRGRKIALARLGEDNVPLSRFLDCLDPERPARVSGTAVYLTSRRDTVPSALALNLRHNKVLHERVVLLNIESKRMPYVDERERVHVHALPKGFWGVTLLFGFAEKPDMLAALARHADVFRLDIEETSFFLGKEVPVPSMRPDLPLWQAALYTFLARNAVSAPEYFLIPTPQVVELGTRVEL